MRPHLLVASALAPLAFAAGAASAQTTLATSQNGPVLTSSVAPGQQPGDLVIASGVTITQTTAGAAVTRDTGNSVLNQGTITATDVDNTTGVLLIGGQTGRFENAGTINITSSYTATDSANSDGILEAPFASGTGRYGVRLTGTLPSGGDVIHDGGSISVKGNNSYGISLEAPITGELIVASPVILTGDNGSAIRTSAVAGNATLSGGISATGLASTGAVFNGDIGGRLSIYGSISASGYASQARGSTAAINTAIQNTPADVQQGGSALIIGGNVGGGVFLGANVLSSTADADGDGIVDGSEGTGFVSTAGSAPAVVVGATGRGVALGNYGTGDNAYGLIVRGTIAGSGVFDGVAATGLQLGVAGGTADLSGGLRVVGNVLATSYAANATAIHILAGTSVAQLRNEGTITGAIEASTTAVTAGGILIDAGANTPLLTNAGILSAAAIGDAASAAAVVDRSGTLTTFENSNTISATLTPTATGDALTGTATAVDLSANTTGVTFTQDVNASGTTPKIIGDVLLGSGPNTVNLLGGTVVGALSLGAAPSSLTLDNGAAFTGPLRYSGSALAVNVANGVLTDTSTATLGLSSLNVGAKGVISFAVDPAAGKATAFVVSGPATLATGAGITLNLLSTSATAQTFTLIASPQLSVGALDQTSLAQLPFLVAANLRTDATGGTVQVDVRRRTASELGLDASAGSALDVVTSGVQRQEAVQAALLAQTTQAGFLSAYTQLLPDRSDGVFRFTELASREIGRTIAEFRDTVPADGGGAWVQQLVFGYQQDHAAAAQASKAGAYGAAAGVTTAQGPFGSLGLTGSFATGTVEETDRLLESNANVTEIEGRLSWQARVAGLRLDASGGAGYVWLTDVRGVSIPATGSAAALAVTSKSDSSAWTASARAGAGYQLDLGRWYVRPQAHVDYFRLDQDAYSESGGGSGVDLAYGERTGSLASATASLVLGGRFGRDLVWRPSVEVGARDILTGDAGLLTAGYAAGGAAYSLAPIKMTGTQPMARLALKAGGDTYEFQLEAEAQGRDQYREGAVKATARFAF